MNEPSDDRAQRQRSERERRRRRRAALQRRRALAIGALLAGIVGLTVAVGGLTGGGDDGEGGGQGGASQGDRTGAGPGTRAGQPEPRRPVRPVRRVPRSERDVPVPILMYHLVNDPPAGAPLPELYVAKDDFAGEMRWLKANGYTAVTLQRVYDLWRKGVALPRRPVVLTFDDGYRSIWANARPILRRMRWPGLLYLQLDMLENTSQGGISPGQVRALLAAGWELESHTTTHPDLTTLDDAQLTAELVDSRREIRRLFGRPATFFCYPAGRYDARVIDAVRRAGYLTATTTQYGNAGPDQMLTLNRVRINRSDGVEGFAEKMKALEGARVSPAPPAFTTGGGGGG
ncbi:MAG: polysaccharide deacetylase family protein [Solirubrobacteraceae bacterium]